jgi:hypothetical protein
VLEKESVLLALELLVQELLVQELVLLAMESQELVQELVQELDL